MHATGTYTSAETPNYMETTRIRAPKRLITRNRRPSPENATNIPDFREKIQGFILIQRARVTPRCTHARALRHDVRPRHLLRGRSRERAGAIQAQRLRAVRLERRATRREVARRGTPRRRDARFRAMGPPMRYARARARARARRAGERDATRVGTGEIRRRDAREGGSRGVATEIFSSSTSRRRRRGDVDDADEDDEDDEDGVVEIARGRARGFDDVATTRKNSNRGRLTKRAPSSSRRPLAAPDSRIPSPASPTGTPTKAPTRRRSLPRSFARRTRPRRRKSKPVAPPPRRRWRKSARLPACKRRLAVHRDRRARRAARARSSRRRRRRAPASTRDASRRRVLFAL